MHLRPIPTTWLIFALILIKGILFVILLPPWQGPDEPTRFEAVYLTAQGPLWPPTYAENGSLQHLLIGSMRQFHAWRFYDREEPSPTAKTLAEANLPSGPSILYEPPSAYFPFTWLIRLFSSQDLLSCLYAGRFLSLILHMACVLLVARLVPLLLPPTSTELPGQLILLFYGLHPQLSFLAASLHADNLGYLLSATILFLLFKIALNISGNSQKLWWLYLLFLLPLTGLTVYLVRKMIILLPFILISLPLLFWPKLKKQGNREAVSGILLLFAAAVVFSAFLLYSYPEILGWRLLGNPHLAKVEDLMQVGLSTWWRYILILFTTFWMALGALVYKLSLGWMTFLVLSTLAVLMGWICLVYAYVCKKIPASIPRFSYLWIHGLWIAWVVLSVFLAYGPHRPNPEGRYLLSAMPSIAFFWCVGLSGWFFLFSKRYSDFLFRLWTVFAILLNLTVVFHHLIPVFYLS